jgi:hypothetical protein
MQVIDNFLLSIIIRGVNKNMFRGKEEIKIEIKEEIQYKHKCFREDKDEDESGFLKLGKTERSCDSCQCSNCKENISIYPRAESCRKCLDNMPDCYLNGFS